jgi:hypothetical protein
MAILARASLDESTRWLLLILFLFAVALLLAAGCIALFTFVNIRRSAREDEGVL